MAYYEIYQMDQLLAVADETLRLLRDLAETARTMYAGGEGRQADVLRAQVEIARMEEEITRMRVERVSAAARLNAWSNRAADAPIGAALLPVFSAALPPLDRPLAEAQAQRPMVKAGEAELRAALGRRQAVATRPLMAYALRDARCSSARSGPLPRSR